MGSAACIGGSLNFEQLNYCFRIAHWKCSFFFFVWTLHFVHVVVCFCRPHSVQMKSVWRWHHWGQPWHCNLQFVFLFVHIFLLCLWLGTLKNLGVAIVFDFLTNCHLWIASVMCTRSCVYINIGIYTYYKCVKNNCLLFFLFWVWCR